MEKPNESRETLGNTRVTKINEKNSLDSSVEIQVEPEVDESKSLYRQSVEPQVSQEEADRVALNRTLRSIDNRLTVIDGGMARVKTET